MASFPPFLCLPGEKGGRFSGAFDGAQHEGDVFSAKMQGTGVQITFLNEIPDQAFSIYGAVVLESEPCFLGIDAETLVVPHVSTTGATFELTIKELCAGMGGIGCGGLYLGGRVIASLDITAIAAKHLHRNQHGQVFLHDLHNDQAKGELHVCGEHATVLVSGFPCQPHSTQGARLGAADPRHQVFVQVLRTAYLHDSECLLLECTPQAQFDAAVRENLIALAAIKNWQIRDVTLALSHQWPCRRHRWWVLLSPMSWALLEIPKWPMDGSHDHIATIMPSWGLWNGDHEHALQLTTEELRAYTDVKYGDDKRLLELTDMGPTFLHSYSNALDNCPCGCRLTGFSPFSLETRGLRGCFVISKLHGHPRYLHPSELGALMGFPPTVIYGEDARADNCLLGQCASPLQAMWIFSYLISQQRGDSPVEAFHGALAQLQVIKRRLVCENFQMWKQDTAPWILTLRSNDGTEAKILTAGSVTVEQLIRAETFTLQPGQMMHIFDGPCPLPPHQYLLERGAYGPYHIHVTDDALPNARPNQVMIGLQHRGQFFVAFLDTGSFLFEALHREGIDGITHCEDASGRFFGLDYRVWGSIMLQTVVSHNDSRTATTACGSSATTADGLNDVTMWTAMTSLCHSMQPVYDERPLLIPPGLALRLLEGHWTELQRRALKSFFEESNGVIHCFFAADNHWALLSGCMDGMDFEWTYFDGFRSSLLTQANNLARKLSCILGLDFCPVHPCSLQPQTLDSSCGTIAIMHLCILLGLSGHFTTQDEARLHEWLVAHQQPKCAFIALGRPTVEVQEQLSKLLADKGVPSDKVDQRVSDAIKTLGNSSIQEAFGATNPWAALKALASRPNSRFRWVLADELQKHIESQAGKKHGALIPGAKHKKQKSKKQNALTVIDHETLQLIPGTFVDNDDDEIEQIDFEEVVNDATGLAFASMTQARPFIESAKILSTTTLGLLIPSEVPKDFWGDAQLEHIRFPALCTATQEPMLISGTLLNLSDGVIHRKEHDNPDIKTFDTAVVKIQIFQDEINCPWEQVTAGPIRALLQHVPLFRLCPGKQCGRDCPLFHAPVGDSLPNVILDIWSRSFHNQQGKSTQPLQAALFQAMLRIPEVALEAVVKTIVKGVYIEPRAAQHKGTHPGYGVIWLNGSDREQALHQLRTCSHGLAIARLGQRYGIRVLKTAEPQAHKLLRPQDEYIPVEVRQVYSLYPLPHGLSRAQMVKLLGSWKWLAKPLQPSRGTIHGQTWLVGSETAPPQPVMHGFDNDVLITLQKDATPQEPKQSLVISQRTKKFLKEGFAAAAASGDDPWAKTDPWGGWRPSSAAASSAAPAPSRFEQLQQTIQDEIKKQVTQAPPGLEPTSDIQCMKVSIAELQAQGQQFQGWFKEAGTRMQQSEAQIQKLQHVVETQGQQVQQQIAEINQEVDNRTQILQSTLQGSIAAMSSDLDSKLSSQFDRFEALLAKKGRTS